MREPTQAAPKPPRLEPDDGLTPPLRHAAVPRTRRYVDHPPAVDDAVDVNRGMEGI